MIPALIYAAEGSPIISLSLENILIAFIGFLTAGSAAAIPYFFNRYKNAQETKKVSVDTDSIIAETSMSLVEFVRTQMDIIKIDLDKANKKIKSLEAELQEVRRDLVYYRGVIEAHPDIDLTNFSPPEIISAK